MTATTTATRLIEIRHARIMNLVDPHGKQFSNAAQLEVLIEQSPDAHWLFEQIGPCFVAECDGFIEAFWHDGSERNAGGFAGREFPIVMKDGSQRVLRGPWAATPSQFYNDVSRKFGPLADIHHTRESDRWTGNKGLTFGYWVTMDRALDACEICDPPLRQFPMMMPVPIVLPNNGITFGLVKRPDSASEWKFERFSGFPALRVYDNRPEKATP